MVYACIDEVLGTCMSEGSNEERLVSTISADDRAYDEKCDGKMIRMKDKRRAQEGNTQDDSKGGMKLPLL